MSDIDQMIDYLEAFNYGEPMSADSQDLSRLIVEIQSAGQDWIKSKLKSDQLVDGEKNYLAALMNNLEMSADGRKMSEGKLERLARGAPEFGQYVTGKCTAVAETARKRVRYESLRDLFEARRSEMAFLRMQIEKGIFSEGK